MDWPARISLKLDSLTFLDLQGVFLAFVCLITQIWQLAEEALQPQEIDIVRFELVHLRVFGALRVLSHLLIAVQGLDNPTVERESARRHRDKHRVTRDLHPWCGYGGHYRFWPQQLKVVTSTNRPLSKAKWGHTGAWRP